MQIRWIFFWNFNTGMRYDTNILCNLHYIQIMESYVWIKWNV